MKLNYFNFKSFKEKMLLTNDFGKYIFVTKNEFKQILKKDLNPYSSLGQELMKKGFIYDATNYGFSNSKKGELQNIKGYVNSATSLHIFVVTTACNANCAYCQANNGKSDYNAMFMNEATAQKTVDIALQSPAHYLDFEFQGGEPLMNFEIIKYIVKYAEEHKSTHEIRYSIVTNLTLVTDEILEYLKAYRFNISTSVDGTEFVHNANRPLKINGGTFQKTINGVRQARKAGFNVGAIKTVSKISLNYPKEIISAFCSNGFDNVFIRQLTPLGKAALNWDKIGYAPNEFINFYIKALEEIICLNQNGYNIRENHAAIILQRINGYPINYMELRSPCGAAIGQIAYYPNGNIFTCDEGRMLYEMGDNSFLLGNAFDNTYQDLILSTACKAVCCSSILETLPNCCDCVYMPYCGVCPVVNYSEFTDIIEKKPHSYRCRIYTGIFDFIFDKIHKNDLNALNVFNSWVT